MNISTRLLARIALLLGLVVAPATFAQTLLTDTFTNPTSSANSGVGNWLYYNGACLTAGIGTGTVAAAPASTIPACVIDGVLIVRTTCMAQDADQYLVGGANGYLGGTMRLRGLRGALRPSASPIPVGPRRRIALHQWQSLW